MMERKSYMMIFLVALLNFGCSKDFLESKPASNLNVPTSLADLELLLENTSDFRSPSLGQLSSDDVWIGAREWGQQTKPYFANSYVWKADIFEGQGNINDWNQPYAEVLATNVVLQQLEHIERTAANATRYDNVKGMALFKRAYTFFDLAQLFAPPFDPNASGAQWGIPLRLTADINAPNVRATLAQTYERILSDALVARSMLSVAYQKNYFNRPTKTAAFGLLSRVYLSLADYPKAAAYADSALQIHAALMDYNTLSTSSRLPFSLINDEQIYLKYLTSNDPMIYIYSSQGYGIDPALYQSYENDDLRKALFFSVNGNTINKKGGYSGSASLENSMATDELFLTRAECYARLGKTELALADLNRLLVKRFRTGTFLPRSGLQGTALVNEILSERRKELVMRGLRWMDLRRLNKAGAGITIKRSLDGREFSLGPNDPRYTLPIPPDVIQYSNMPQNNR